ncbi:hypothetical protein HF086_004588 [Spodoptera exigua]|uniref:CAP-Gly domain-containing protein n=1 Tax=Spodoptera exigua TaxID=7107 RepID=A0A922MQ17_SPOEX|nr:hypothetical protein HF086_004588 [Spodoptera exigua]
MADIQVITQDYVNVLITKSDSEDAAPIERRFKKGITILEFKTKLELVTGGSAATMKLKLYDKKNGYICDIDNDEALLGSFPIDDGMRIHVVDKFALLHDFGSSESAERFRLSEEEYQKKAEAVLVGARCEVRVPQQPVRRATVRYNGPLEGAKGLWIGVQYDEPRGKNDGSVNGKRYFTCPPKYGGFVKPVYVTVGDFPEEEFDLDDEI